MAYPWLMLLAALLAVAAQDPQAGNARFEPPSAIHWYRTPDGFAVFVKEPDFCRLTVHPGRPLEGDFRAAFDAAVAAQVKALGALKATHGVKDSVSRQGVPILQQTVEIETKHGTSHAWCVGANPGGRFEFIVYAAGSPATWLARAEDAKAFMTSLSFANAAAPADFKKGDAVEVLFGGQWYKAVVLETAPGKWKIHYEGYGDNWDSWVERDKIRRRDAAPVEPRPAPAPPSEFKAGDRVEVLFGGQWYKAVVLEAGAAKWKIHYEGYGDTWDSWVERDKIRRLEGAAAPAAEPAKDPGTDPIVGELCEASWNGTWYEVKILRAEPPRFLVEWRGYAKEEWLTRDRLRRKGEEKELAPRAGREGDGGGRPPAEMVGKDVEVFWRRTWWPATVLKTDGTRLFIRYITPLKESVREEWAVKERVRAVGGAARHTVAPGAVRGARPLSGLWVWSLPGPSGSIRLQQIAFFEDGRVYHGPPPDGMDHVDWKLWQKTTPDQCGAYGVEGAVLRFEFGGDAEPWADRSFERVDADRIKIAGFDAFRAPAFRKGETLDGLYQYGSSGQAPIDKGFNATVVQYRFKPDGSFDYLKSDAMMDAKDAAGTLEERYKGRYVLEAQTLTLLREGGGVERLSCFPLDDPRDKLVIGLHFVARQKGR